MSLPNVTFEILNGQLGSFEPQADRVMGLIVAGVAADELALATSKAYFSLAEVEADGIDEDYDTDNDLNVYANIKAFYNQTGSGAELWLMIVAQTNTMAAMCLKTNTMAKKLLTDAGGRICVLGVMRVPDEEYTATTTSGLDNDVATARTNAQALAVEEAGLQRPVRVLLDGRQWGGNVGSTTSIVTEANNRVATLLGSDVSGSSNAAIGLALGCLAKVPPQRKISRVKNGPTGLTAAYLTNGATVETIQASWDALHDKGFVFFRKFPGKSGYFFTSDRTACPGTDDYTSLARGRVIDKVQRIAYQTFVEEIEDDVEVDGSGYLSPAVAKGYEAKIERAILLDMSEEISSVKCTIDPAQDILGTNLVQVTKLGVIPRGYSSYIDVPLGFTNPLNEA